MATAELKTLLTKRGIYKGQVTRFSNFLAKLDINENEVLIKQINIKLEKIYEVYNLFSQTQLEIEILEGQEDSTEREDFEDLYFEVVARAKLFLEKWALVNNNENSVPVPSATNSSLVEAQQINVKLPVIHLPIFYGQYDQWIEFRDTFNALINQNVALSDIQRFHYLRSSLRDKASQVLSSLSVSASNYKVAWDLLIERYDNRKLIIQNHISALFNMPSVHRESHIHLRQLLDTFQKHLRALSALELPVEHWDILLIHIVVSKLDLETKKEWQEFESDKKLPTVTDMLHFLKKRCTILESLVKNVNIRGESKIRAYATTITTNKCKYCNEGHNISQCSDFLKLNITDRHAEVNKRRLCFNCLKGNHIVRNCIAPRCIKCHKRHNVLLHFESEDQQPAKRVDTKLKPNEDNESTIVSHSRDFVSSKEYVLLSTAVVIVYDKYKNIHKLRVLLDTGSQSNFITEKAAKILSVNRFKCNKNIVGISQLNASVNFKTDIIIHNLNRTFSFEMSCLILPKITDDLPRINHSLINIPGDVMLADPNYSMGGEIDILMGSAAFWQLLGKDRIILDKRGLALFETKLGWVLGGKVELDNNYSGKIISNVCVSCEQTKEILQKFWEIENLNSKKEMSQNEKFCETHFLETHQRDDSGRFIVQIPFNDNIKKLGTCREIALKRFLNLEKRFEKDLELHREYKMFMSEYLRLGHMSLVYKTDNGDGYFLPHHAVFKTENNIRKIRVVFDGSAKSSTGVSLNDAQYVGPTIQSELFSILIRFRQHAFVLTADVVKMYRQVLISKEHRKYQLIFWRENSTDPLQTFQLNTVTYGQACAPYLAIRSLTQIGIELEKSDPVLANIIKNDFYVDDLLTGSHTMSELLDIKERLTKALASGGFLLSKWCVNVQHEQDAINISCLNDRDKILGVRWNPRDDILYYSVNDLTDSQTYTKRIILSQVSQLYDPLGILGPIIILAKILIQRLWLLQLGWDELVPNTLTSEWIDLKTQLKNIETIKVPRCIIHKGHVNLEIHGFSDASEQAYGACVYVRSETTSGYYTRLLCAKSRVAPVKKLSLPRLELCGAVLLSELLLKVKNSLTISINKFYCWTDSTVVLCWIKNKSTTWKTFVANRISIIQSNTNADDWYHIKSKDNPADVISRGLLPNELINSVLWFEGPIWLKYDSSEWPKQNVLIKNDNLLETKTVVLNTITDKRNFDFCERYSNYNLLISSFAYVLRFIHNVRNKTRLVGKLTQLELNSAINKLVSIVQTESFFEDIEQLKKRGHVLSKSRLLSLNPFLDRDGLLRVGGRLSQSNYEYDKKYPLLLPHKHKLTSLIMEHKHKTLLHCGAHTLLNSIREKFWPIGGKSLAKRITKNCIICFKTRPRIQTYKMGDLPNRRVTPSRPFLVSGTDFAGPFLVKDRATRGVKLLKAYVCIFVCFATKAVHLELVADLTSDSFLAALTRFFARRGLSSDIYSDNATNYVGANKQIKNITLFLKENENLIWNDLNKQGVTWHFIPPGSPHFGGLWESTVKNMKIHLLKTIGEIHLRYDEFVTILARVEACLNSRPLTSISDDPADLNPLTPAHFLIGGPIYSIPEIDIYKERFNSLSRWEKTQQITQHFWRRWMRDYIQQLQGRTKWRTQTDNCLRIGDLVLLMNENTPPLR